MKKLISLLLLFSLSQSLFAAPPSASSLGEEILSDLLDLYLQIENLRKQLESLEQRLNERELNLKEREQLTQKREQLMNEREESMKRKENLLNQLSNLVDEQAQEYRASLGRWKFLTISLGILSAALAGIAIYQGVSK